MVDDFAGVRSRLERERESGAAFDHAWPVAVAGANLTDAGQEAVQQTRKAWQAAYNRHPPTPADRALVAVAASWRA